MKKSSNKTGNQYKSRLIGIVVLAGWVTNLALLTLLSTFVLNEQVAKATTPTNLSQTSGHQSTAPHSSNTITQSAELVPTPNLEIANCSFGNVTALSGDGSTAFMGGWGCEEVIVFTKSGSLWVQTATLTTADNFGGDGFGLTISSSYDGSTVLIGAYYKNNFTGSVYAFSKNGTEWSQNAELIALDGTPGDNFGNAVSISDDGSTALIAAVGRTVGGYREGGVAYIFTRDGTLWSQSAEISNSDRTGGDQFGYSVSISSDGSTALIGAINHDVGSVAQAGAAYIFTKNGTSWNQSAKLTPNDPDQEDHFGSAVSIADDDATAVIGSPYHPVNGIVGIGVAYIFAKNNTTWSQNAELTDTFDKNHTLIGSGVAISGDGANVIIGINEFYYSSTGAAFVFNKDNNVWNEKDELIASDSNKNFFGKPVSISRNGSTELIGGTNAAYVYYSNTTSNCQPGATANSSTPITSTYTYYLPFLACNSDNYTTYLAFQNTSNITATLTLQYFNPLGVNVPTPLTTCSSLAPLAECIAPNPFTDGNRGTGIIYSSQPLNVIVSEATPYGGSAYAVSQGASNDLIAPVIIHNGLGDFTTNLNIFNSGNNTVTGTVQFYQQDGTLVITATKSFTLTADTSINYDQTSDSTLGNSFYGWAQISSPSGSQLVAQVLEQSPSQHFVALANAQATAQPTLYAAAIFHNAYGTFNTGVNIVNPNSQPVTVNVTYYDKDGSTYTAPTFQLAAHSLQGIYQGSTAAGTGLPTTLLPDNFAGAAIVTATSGVIMVVNEFGGVNANGNAKSGTYSASAVNSNSVGLPVIANGGYGYTTGATIFNTSSQTIAGTIQYYNIDGTTSGNAKSFSVGPHQSFALYQGDSSQGLATNFYGTAIVTESGGGKDLIITTNAASSAFFYTYTEPS